jgi:excisionase family DNA binding protein
MSQRTAPQPHEPARTKAARTSMLVPAAQAAAELGLPYTTLRGLAFKGEFSVVKIGRAWYFRRLDLEAFVSRQLRALVG